MSSMETGDGRSTDQPAVSDNPAGGGSPQTVEDPSNRECRGSLDGGSAPSGNMPVKTDPMFESMTKRAAEEWDKKLGVALRK